MLDAVLSTDLADFIRGDDGSVGVLDQIFYTDYAISSLPNGVAFNIGFAIPGEIAIKFPGVDDLALIIGAGGAGVTSLQLHCW